MITPRWNEGGEVVTIKRKSYKVIEMTSANAVLRHVLLAQGRKLSTATQCLTGEYTTPVKVEGWSL